MRHFDEMPSSRGVSRTELERGRWSKPPPRSAALNPRDALLIFIACAVFRVFNAFAVRTYFNADEFWQSLEVAHRMVFGYGYVTWEWTRGLRGFTHPLIFAAVYKVAAMLGLDSVPVLVWSPRVVQALIAARNWNGERGLGTGGVFLFLFVFPPHFIIKRSLFNTTNSLRERDAETPCDAARGIVVIVALR